ncbi:MULTISPECIES: pentapeptide repeat-containing protein [unclassified Streptomyces]|uniref:pentapeptide repeat-containing protein n=1 Tax=Streptomyces sp. NPDC127532 TaxID=3345399 RepID=UPI0036393599
MPPETPLAAEERPGALDWARRIELFTVVVASFVAVLGLWFSSVQSQDDRALAKEGQITDRYTAAVGNLAEDTMDVRLGGIYALQRIMTDSHRDQPTIANVLAAYIRTHAAKPPAKGQDVSADVLAALTVLATRDATYDGAFRLDLRGAKLPGAKLTPVSDSSRKSGLLFSHADLSGADLSGVVLIGADLSAASLKGADLSNASLIRADLSNAVLLGADLSDATLVDADLSDAHLSSKDPALIDAHLSPLDLPSADLRGAVLDGANLSGANLSGAENVTRKQVDSARTDGNTQLPASLS